MALHLAGDGHLAHGLKTGPPFLYDIIFLPGIAILLLVELLEQDVQGIINMLEADFHIVTHFAHLGLDFGHGLFEVIATHIDIGQVLLDGPNIDLEFMDRVPDYLQYPAEGGTKSSKQPVYDTLIHDPTSLTDQRRG